MTPEALLMILLQSASTATPAAAPVPMTRMMADYRRRTSATVPCERPKDSNDVIVCARRDADRYRVPLIMNGANDRLSTAARVEALKGPTMCERHSTFMVGCGMAGVSVTAGFGGKGAAKPTLRPLAP